MNLSEHEMCNSTTELFTITSTELESLHPTTFVPSAKVKSKWCFFASTLTQMAVGEIVGIEGEALGKVVG